MLARKRSRLTISCGCVWERLSADQKTIVANTSCGCVWKRLNAGQKAIVANTSCGCVCEKAILANTSCGCVWEGLCAGQKAIMANTNCGCERPESHHDYWPAVAVSMRDLIAGYWCTVNLVMRSSLLGLHMRVVVDVYILMFTMKEQP